MPTFVPFFAVGGMVAGLPAVAGFPFVVLACSAFIAAPCWPWERAIAVAEAWLEGAVLEPAVTGLVPAVAGLPAVADLPIVGVALSMLALAIPAAV